MHEWNIASHLLHGEERLIYGNAGHIGKHCAEVIGYEMREEFQDCGAEFRIAMKPGQRRVLPETAEGKLLDLVEKAEAHFRAMVKHPFWIVKCWFGFRKAYCQGIPKNELKLKILFLWRIYGWCGEKCLIWHRQSFGVAFEQ